MEKIGIIRTDFPEKFGLPRQSGLIGNLKGKIIFEEKYRVREAFRGLEEFSHIWILWEFSEAKRETWSPTVRPPKLGGNERVGVFATRSPFRPNPIGLSCVKLDEIKYTSSGPVLYVSGVDMMDGTPVYDIKPYIPYADSRLEATGGFVDRLALEKLTVVDVNDKLLQLTEEKRAALVSILESDPRPAYKKDGDRVYKFEFAQWEIDFKVMSGINYIVDIKPIN